MQTTFAKATDAAKSCADVVLLDNDFSHLKDVIGEGRRVIGNIQRTSILYLMKAIAVIIFAFGLIPFAKGQIWFSIENVYMLAAAVIVTGGFLLSLEPRKTPVRGSFIGNINRKALAAGALAAVAILMPIMMYTIPIYYERIPFIGVGNVRAMMTILMTMAGIIVVLSMCIPFNKYRAFTLIAVIVVASTLGMMLPTSYIGGKPMGASMFSYDSSLGQTIFDSPFFHEFLRPWNSPVIRDIIDDPDNYVVMRIFMFVAVPIFIIIMQAIDRKLKKGYGELEIESKTKVAGKMLLIMTSISLFIQSGMMLINIVTQYIDITKIVSYSAETVEDISKMMLRTGATIATMIVLSVMFMIMGIFGYKTWHKQSKKNMKRTSLISLIMLVIYAIVMLVSGVAGFAGNAVGTVSETLITTKTLSKVDGYIAMTTTLIYMIAAILIWVDSKRKSNVSSEPPEPIEIE